MTSLLTTASSGPPTHRTRSWKLRWLAPVVVSSTLLIGGAASAQESTPAPATPTDATPAPDAPRIEVEFTELNDSGATGTATLTADGEQTLVQLNLEGTGANHPAHIHKGTCDDIEAVPAYNLENVGEEGTSTTLVDAPLQDLIDGDYVIDLHLAPNQLGTLIDCADIEGTPAAPGVGGEGTPTATAEATESATEAQATETATSVSVAAPTETPTPTEPPTATEAPTQEPTVTASKTPSAVGGVSTTTTNDGTGADTTTSGVSDPTLSGKGVPVGGDGTDGQAASLSSTGGTGDLPSAAGSGSSLLSAHTPRDAALQAMAGFSAILLLAGIALRRGESTRMAGKPARFGRLGL